MLAVVQETTTVLFLATRLGVTLMTPEDGGHEHVLAVFPLGGTQYEGGGQLVTSTEQSACRCVIVLPSAEHVHPAVDAHEYTTV
jgi:hypothetical protein